MGTEMSATFRIVITAEQIERGTVTQLGSMTVQCKDNDDVMGAFQRATIGATTSIPNFLSGIVNKRLTEGK